MNTRRSVGIRAAVAGACVVALVVAPSVSGQEPSRASTVLAGRGSEIGVSIRDVERAEADRQHLAGGAFVEEVRPDTPAAKAGLKPSDIIVEFDGERVRSARQFARLVQETAPGREIKTTIVRDGQKKELPLTPSGGRGMAPFMYDGDRLRERLGDLNLRDLPNLADRMRGFNFDVDLPGTLSGRRLGVTVDELTHQLADYFGVKDGVLVTAVTDGTAAARAGLTAGDVVTSINGSPVHTRGDLVRGVRAASSDEIAIGIVRDKKESTLKATLESPPRTTRGGRPA